MKQTKHVFLCAVIVVHCLTVSLRANESNALDIKRDIVFAEVDGKPLTLNLYLPPSDTACPLVVWIHGGGWRGGSKNSPRIRDVANNRFALASITYRFTNTATFPAQIHDCKAAIRWLRANASRYGYNADRIAVAGSSAGGHLALLLGTSGGVTELERTVGGNLETSSTVQAVIDYYGPSDFVLRGETQPERAYTDESGSFALLGGVDGKRLDIESEKFASPTQYVSSDDPPLLVFHGTSDTTVLLDQSEQIAKRYSEIGLPVELVVIEHAGHGSTIFFNDANLRKATRFLREHLRAPH
ncbi:alpha/beta hydrolase [Aporhodopirellula aestuarii]|uniref:Alpha/beta hydrolase n=1 Tax=Aporhodopirellula aestuarii TaxID=2950107 RepID=A0ABT0UA60_9BACT|nr:alpha/beta hydrolase [Aporhodopirellula aestuarii]MCM2373815.1 alpha/beta hydrolase [Aporhodopirellula aestuarii]